MRTRCCSRSLRSSFSGFVVGVRERAGMRSSLTWTCLPDVDNPGVSRRVPPGRPVTTRPRRRSRNVIGVRSESRRETRSADRRNR
ncbi:hypothetical protein ACFPM0_35875 [Pseudonocardia sulfidoxydans]|uniref:hypothetical protein n=1 Tax=Pseudonocardia sulfidoxydans TaxID=54011 RepID=UPI0036220FC9